MNHLAPKKQGIAILYAVLLITVIMTIGLILSDIITKQIILSSTGRSSQEAFSAAIAGRECYNYWDLSHAFDRCEDSNGTCERPDTIRCGNQDVALSRVDSNTVEFVISYAKTENTAPACTKAVIKSGAPGGYDADGNTCITGTCFEKFLLFRGYNSTCADIGKSPRTLERATRVLR